MPGSGLPRPTQSSMAATRDPRGLFFFAGRLGRGLGRRALAGAFAGAALPALPLAGAAPSAAAAAASSRRRLGRPRSAAPRSQITKSRSAIGGRAPSVPLRSVPADIVVDVQRAEIGLELLRHMVGVGTHLDRWRTMFSTPPRFSPGLAASGTETIFGAGGVPERGHLARPEARRRVERGSPHR